MVTKLELLISTKLSVFNRSLFRSSLAAMNLGQCAFSSASGRDVFLRRVHGVTLRKKVHSCEIRKPAEYRATYHPNRKIPAGSATWPDCPTKDLRGKSSWLHPREREPKVDQGPGCMITSPTYCILVPPWCRTSITFWDCCWPWDISYETDKW